MRSHIVRPALALGVLATLGGCGFNTVPTKEEAAKAKWADVQNQYQRRADLIPNLVEAVKGAASNERGTLVGVTQARAAANQIKLSPDQLTDPAAMARFQAAQSQVTVSLQRLQEAYPDLKTNENFRDLNTQLEGTENRITTARSDYNAAVQDYNTTIRTFPAMIAAKAIYGAKPLVPFQATSANADRAPSVKF